MNASKSKRIEFKSQVVEGQLEPGEYWDTLLAGFGLRVRATRRTYFVRVRQGGKRPRIELGQCPQPGMSSAERKLTIHLAKARALAGDKLQLKLKGVTLRPPVLTAERLAAGTDHQLHPDTMTLAALGAAWLAWHAPLEGADDVPAEPLPVANGRSVRKGKNPRKRWTEGTHTDYSWFVNRLLVPAWGPRLVKDILRREVRDLLEAYADQAPVAANRLHSVVVCMFNWAVQREYLASNAAVVKLEKPGGDEDSRGRLLSHAELRTYWTTLDAVQANADADPRDQVQADIHRLRLLTLQRESALRRMRWTWVHLEDGLVEFPPRAMKRRKQRHPFVLPLGKTALALLKARRLKAHASDVFVWASRKGTTRCPGTARGIKYDLPDFQGKDIRRTGTTMLATQGGYNDPQLALILNHANNSITGIYNRYEYFAEKLAMLQLLDDAVQALLADKPLPQLVQPQAAAQPSKVRQFKRA